MNRRGAKILPIAALMLVAAAIGCGVAPGVDPDEVDVDKPARHEPFTIKPAWKLSGEDTREAAHGIDIIEVGDKLAVIWSAQDGPSVDGDWTHDIQRAFVDRDTPDLNETSVEPLIDSGGAQEPASSSVTGNSSITTWEDDSGEVLSQRFTLYQDGEPLWDEPRTAVKGGHSGHASSARSWHAIALSEGWTPGGGIDNLGSGNVVYLTTIGLDGSDQRVVKVDDGRAWWPLTASSAQTTALLWQKFAADAQSASLKFAVYAPDESGDFQVVAKTEVASDIAYYEYDVAYLADLNSFAVVGNTSDADEPYRGFIVLYDANGNEIAREVKLSPFVRESKPAIDTVNGMVRLTYPRAPSGFQEFLVSPDRIDLGEVIEDDFEWPTSGTAAAVTGGGERYFVAFRDNGIEQIYLD